jgi:hypothetical protein
MKWWMQDENLRLFQINLNRHRRCSAVRSGSRGTQLVPQTRSRAILSYLRNGSTLLADNNAEAQVEPIVGSHNECCVFLASASLTNKYLYPYITQISVPRFLIQWHPRFDFRKLCCRIIKLTSNIPLMPTLRMRGAIPPLFLVYF